MVRKVLIVDDSLTARMGLSEVLLDIGCEVRLAASGADAQELLGRHRFELIVLDVHLADGDTTPLLRRLVAKFYGQATPVLVISGSDALDVRLRALREGAADFIGKPCDPRRLRACAEAVMGLRASAEKGPLRVLVVDDSLTYGHAVAQALMTDGHDVVLAPTAHEALEYLSLQRPDRVLLDVFLPDGDGVDIAREIRGRAALRDLPILMLTGRESTHVRQRAMEAEVTDFLAKSAPLSQIGAWVARPTGAGAAARIRAKGDVDLRTPSDGAPLFARVVALSGLSALVGKTTLELALRRAGTEPDALTPQALVGAITHIEKMLTTFLAPEDVRERVAAITALAHEGNPRT